MKAKDYIIDALIEKPGLSVNEIDGIVKKKQKLSYHAIYKALQIMVIDRTVDKKNGRYYINEDWKNERIEFSKKLLDDVKEFKNVKHLYHFLKKVEDEHLDSMRITWIVNHCYNMLLQPVKKAKYLKSLQEKGIRLNVYCHGRTPLDVWTKKRLEEFGVNIKIDSKIGGLCSYYIYDDLALQIFYSRKFNQVLDEFYNTHDIENMNFNIFVDKLSKEDLKIKVILIRDKEIIERLRRD